MKLSLCLGLLFTFPVMLVPVYEIVEGALLEKPWFVDHVRPSQRKQAFDVVRVCIVALTVLLAAVIPGFGIFISLVGARLVCSSPPPPPRRACELWVRLASERARSRQNAVRCVSERLLPLCLFECGSLRGRDENRSGAEG